MNEDHDRQLKEIRQMEKEARTQLRAAKKLRRSMTADSRIGPHVGPGGICWTLCLLVGCGWTGAWSVEWIGGEVFSSIGNAITVSAFVITFLVAVAVLYMIWLLCWAVLKAAARRWLR